jgi:hypothetical protein
MRVRIAFSSRRALCAALMAAGAMASPALTAVAQERSSAEAFRAIAPVFQSPRCMNCHTNTSFPRQGDDRHRHTMNVARGTSGHGAAAQPCSMCHQRANQSASGVPGADEDWHLAPLSMGWEGLTVAELCRHLLDPARNGGRSGNLIVDHLSTNLVRWAWSAGADRNGRARRAPPLGYDEFVQSAKSWVSAGAQCPN